MLDLNAATRHPRRYMVAGLICATIHNGIMLASDAAGVHYIAALVVSFVVLTPTGYMLQSFYTFERNLEPRRFLRFSGGMLAGFPLNFLLMALLISGIGLDVPVATLLCTGLLFLWNFMCARWAILLR